MTHISAQSVMELRKKMGVSLMACKKALSEADGNVDAAIDILRKSGIERANKKSGRETGEGAVEISGGTAVSLRCETDFVARNEAFRKALFEIAQEAEQNGEDSAITLFERKKAELISQLGENISFGEFKSVSGGSVVGGYVHSNQKIASIVALEGGSLELARDIAMHVVANSPQVLSPENISEDLVEKEKEIWEQQLKNEGKPENIIEKIILGKEKKFREEGALLKQPFVKNPEVTIEQLVKGSGATITSFLRMEV
jgi:elongation factor Ts